MRQEITQDGLSAGVAAASKNPPYTRTKNILLKFRHGLGDAVQLTIVLKHLRRFRPDWNVDVAATIGKHSAFVGLCRRVLILDRDITSERYYDQVFDLPWHESSRGESNAPSTKVTRCLQEVFSIEPDASLYQYEVHISEDAMTTARTYLETVCGGRHSQGGRYSVLLLHYQGNTSQKEKDLSHETAYVVCQAAISSGLVPVILDWDKRSPWPDDSTIFCPGAGGSDIWGGTGTGDAAMLAALISQSAIMVGVDSGPLHVAGATRTRTLAVWTKHFPPQYFDLAKNVTHVVPSNWRSNGWAKQQNAATYFTRNYRHVVYDDLARTLVDKIEEHPTEVMNDSLVRVREFWVRRDNIEQDLVITKDVYENDSYRIGDLPDPDRQETVIDVGAHIGCFAVRYHKKNPKARIICIEACPENIDALRANVGHFAEVINAACTYETDEVALLNSVQPKSASTGGSIVVKKSDLPSRPEQNGDDRYWRDSRTLSKVTLEGVIERLGLNRIDVLKLDCEGSEYSILDASTSLNRIRTIVGEYHDRSRWNLFREGRFVGWHYDLLLDAGANTGLFRYSNPTLREPAGKLPKLLHPPVLRIAVPAGIGDAVWALMKIPAMLEAYGAQSAYVSLCGGPPYRSKEFVERFDFVSKCDYSNWVCVETPSYTPEGVYNWAPSGTRWHHEFDWMLQANRHLENGKRLDTWLAQFDTDWAIGDRFRFTGQEVREARNLEQSLGPFCVFYLGPELGNTGDGHNRGPLWSPQQWGELAEYGRALGLRIVVVGASYDLPYFERHVKKYLGDCENAIGKWGIGQTFAVIQRSRFIISYQSGVGIFSVYLGVPAGVFWRPKGDSISPHGYVSFDEGMASAWSPIETLEAGRHLPLIYTKCTPRSIVDHVVSHGWHF